MDSVSLFTGYIGNPQADYSRGSVFNSNRINSVPLFDPSKATSDIQSMNWKILNQAIQDARRSTTSSDSSGKTLSYKQGADSMDPNQVKALNMLMSGQAGSTAWNDVMGGLRNQYMDRYEGEQKGMQAQLERMRKLGLASQVPTANTPAAQREGALTAALQNGGGTSPMMHKGREVMSPFADRMRNYTQQQQQTQQPTQQQPQTQGAVYGGFGQSPLTQALQSGGQAQVTSNRYRPVTNWGSGGFRSVLSGF